MENQWECFKFTISHKTLSEQFLSVNQVVEVIGNIDLCHEINVRFL